MRILLFSCSILLSLLSFAQPAIQSVRVNIIEQQLAWNRGDIPAFMEGYWKSDQLTFVSTRVTKGWQQTLDNCIFSAPASGPDGRIYVGSQDDFLYGISPSGEVRARPV